MALIPASWAISATRSSRLRVRQLTKLAACVGVALRDCMSSSADQAGSARGLRLERPLVRLSQPGESVTPSSLLQVVRNATTAALKASGAPLWTRWPTGMVTCWQWGMSRPMAVRSS